jgi:hypothetical protein
MDFPPVGGRLKPFPKERARSINLYHRRPEYVKEREKTQIIRQWSGLPKVVIPEVVIGNPFF